MFKTVLRLHPVNSAPLECVIQTNPRGIVRRAKTRIKVGLGSEGRKILLGYALLKPNLSFDETKDFHHSFVADIEARLAGEVGFGKAARESLLVAELADRIRSIHFAEIKE